MYRASKYDRPPLTYSRVIRINRVRLPNLLVVSCIRGKYIYMYWYYSTAVCIGLYTRYQYIFDLMTCTFVHGSRLLYNMHIYIYMCNYSERYEYVELCLYVWPSQPGKVANPARGQ